MYFSFIREGAVAGKAAGGHSYKARKFHFLLSDNYMHSREHYIVPDFLFYFSQIKHI